MQDQAITSIGRLTASPHNKPYQNFIEDMFPRQDNYNMILAVFRVIEKEGRFQCSFEKIDVDNVSSKNYQRYAYRKGSSRGGDITFTTKFGDINKKFKTFYPKQLNDLIAFAKQNDEQEEASLFQALKDYLSIAALDVKASLSQQYEALDKKQQQLTGFSVQFLGLEGGRYLEDFSSIQQLLYQAGTSGKSEKHKVVSEGHHELCAICHEKKPVLHGFASPFKFATVDKTGLVSGFFKQVNNWKNYPICTDCALDFELGKHYITEKLNKNFYGSRFFLIPKLIGPKSDKLLRKALTSLEEIAYQQSKGTQLEAKEEFLLRKIGEQEWTENSYALSLLFYEENPTTKAIKIKLFLEAILPSRFQTLFTGVPKVVNANPLFKQALMVKKVPTDLRFNFGFLKAFFQDDFYAVIQTVFLGLPLSKAVLFAKFMQLIRRNYNKSQTTDAFVEPTKWTVLKAILTFNYLAELNIISINKTIIAMEVPNHEQEPLEQKAPTMRAFDEDVFRQFIEDNSGFFDLQNGYKVGIFAVGVLVKQVFKLQARNLDGNTPFEKKLKAYHLNPKLLKNIYIEALEKIDSYTRFRSYQGLRNLINEYFILNSHKLNQISNHELSFYFVAGLEFGNHFRTEKTNENE